MRLFLESMINYTDIVIVYECILHNKWIFHKTTYHSHRRRAASEWGTTKTAMSAPRLSCPMITVKVTFPRPRSRLWHIHTLSYHHFNTMQMSNVHEFRSKVVPITDARVYGCCHHSTISSDDHLLGAWHYAKADVKESLVYLKWSCRRASRGRRDNQTSYQQQNIL